ncbi:MAG: tetratricopeptide repeat protein [Candidatus Zixiibacteriota bacterium]
MPGNSELIRKHLPRSTEDLWTELGQLLSKEGKLGPTAMIGHLPERNYAADAKLWYSVNLKEIHQRVCIDFDFCTKKQKYKLDDAIALLGALGSVLAGTVGCYVGGSVLALLLLRKGLSGFCGCDTAHPYIERARRLEEDDERQIPLWKRVLKEDPFNYRAYHNLGSTYHRRGRLRLAASNYRTAIELNPDNFSSLNNLAHVLLSENNPPDALRCARQAHRLSPDTSEVNHTLGFALLKNGQPCEAIPHLKKAVEARDDSTWEEILRQAMKKCEKASK